MISAQVLKDSLKVDNEFDNAEWQLNDENNDILFYKNIAQLFLSPGRGGLETAYAVGDFISQQKIKEYWYNYDQQNQQRLKEQQEKQQKQQQQKQKRWNYNNFNKRIV